MTEKSSLPAFFYAIASLAALVIMPALGLIVFGTIGFFTVLALVFLGIMLTRSLFMTEMLAFWLVASLSILTIGGVWAVMNPWFAALVEWANGMKNDRCVDGNFWCQIRDLPMPSEADSWWIGGTITLAIVILNAIWFVTKAMSGRGPSGKISNTTISIGRNQNVPFGVGHGNVISAGKGPQTDETGEKKASGRGPSGAITDTEITIGQDSNAPFVVGHGNVVDTGVEEDSETPTTGKTE
jgi:hypothetical protein